MHADGKSTLVSVSKCNLGKVNSGHKIKKEWVDLEALENPRGRRSLLEYGTVGTTKCSTGKGKRLIIVDCITENGPVPGALWTFSAAWRRQ